ncbi:ATP-dependent Lon protease, partial [Patescibacteria group bacterium]|nr:ATP-dependent Lon protease [Patescibacteria group bacterium]
MNTVLDDLLNQHFAGKVVRKDLTKKIGGMEFYDVHFSYADKETNDEKYISVPEQGGGTLIPDGPMNPGTVHTVARGSNGHLGLYRLEIQMCPGSGSIRISGQGISIAAKECLRIAFDYFKANASRISVTPKAGDHDFHIHVVELHNSGTADA